MNHTLSELPFEVQGVLIFFNWILCMATFSTVAYYTLVVKTLPPIPKDIFSCCEAKKKKKAPGPDDPQQSDEDDETYRARVEAEIDKGRAQLREDMKVEQEFRDLLGMEK